MVPEELTNKELLEPEQECIAEEESREKETAEEKEKHPRKHSEGISRSFCRPHQAP